MKMQLPDVDIATFRVIEDSLIAGSSLSQIGLRKKHGVTLLAIRRNDQVLSNPDGDTTVLAGDILILLGRPPKLSEAASIFRDVEKNSGKGDGNTPGTGSYTLST